MAFEHASAPSGLRVRDALSADNVKPDRFTLVKVLTQAASRIGLGPSVVATVDALLSCLPPKRNHDVVYASNATLVMRRNGISDRTLRRHLSELISAGLLMRIDSPNGKRYAKRDTVMGTALRFGLNLSPLFAAYDKLVALAQEQADTMARVGYLRAKIRALLNTLEGTVCSDVVADMRRALRRQLAVDQLESCLARLEAISPQTEENPVETKLDASDMSASNGQIVRHQQNSVKENIDKARQSNNNEHNLSLNELTTACPEATSFLTAPLSTSIDVINHAKTLAPMIGIDRSCYEAAESRLGEVGTALTIWVLLERQDRISRIGAYFRAITSGKRSHSFDPWSLIHQLVRKSAALSADNASVVAR